MQTVYVFFCTAILSELLLVGFRKIPFTCLHVVNKDLVLVNVIFFFLGFAFFGPGNAVIEARLLQNPTRLALLPILYIAVRIGARRRERDLSPGNRTLIFEDRPEAAIQVLDLSR